MAFTKVDYVNGTTVIMAENLNAIQDEFALKANIASPTFTGTPKSVTPSASDNSTRIATTAYVKSNLSGYGNVANLSYTTVTS